jgi:hypothetical protein
MVFKIKKLQKGAKIFQEFLGILGIFQEFLETYKKLRNFLESKEYFRNLEKYQES